MRRFVTASAWVLFVAVLVIWVTQVNIP